MFWESYITDDGLLETRRINSEHFSPNEAEIYENIPSTRMGQGAELINGGNMIASRSHMHRLNQVHIWYIVRCRIARNEARNRVFEVNLISFVPVCAHLHAHTCRVMAVMHF